MLGSDRGGAAISVATSWGLDTKRSHRDPAWDERHHVAWFPFIALTRFLTSLAPVSRRSCCSATAVEIPSCSRVVQRVVDLPVEP